MKKIILIPLIALATHIATATTYIVSSTNSNGPGTLIDAITDANANPGYDSIVFDIPGTPPHSIMPVITATISITDTLYIDGTTQPDNGYTGNCPKIVIDASPVDSAINELIRIDANNVSIYGIWFKSFIGSATTILSVNAMNAVIGAPGKKNLFTDANHSILLLADSTEINSNYFGCNCDGTGLAQNTGNAISGGIISYTQIKNNIISGNLNGIILGTGIGPSDKNIIQGNYIGTDYTGTLGLGNSENGINLIYHENLTLGGSSAGEENVISANEGTGCSLMSCSGTVLGNKIGTDITGVDTLPNDPSNLSYNSALNCVGIPGINCNLTIGASGANNQNIIVGNDIALNISDTSGTYFVSGNLIGQTLNGYVSHLQNIGLQMTYDTIASEIKGNYIYGSMNCLNIEKCANTIFNGNFMGVSIIGAPLSPLGGIYAMNSENITLTGNVVTNCGKGIQLFDCNNFLLSINTITHCSEPLELGILTGTCHYNQFFKNALAFNNRNINLNNGTPSAANDDIMPPIILGATVDSIWGTSLPNALIDLCRDTTLDPVYPQGYDYSIPQFSADTAGNWVAYGLFANAHEYTAMQTDSLNNSSNFASRLPVGIHNISENTIRLFPVPANDILTIESIQSVKIHSWKILNVLGSIVLEGKSHTPLSLQIDISNLTTGSYFIKIVTDKNLIIRKFIKE